MAERSSHFLRSFLKLALVNILSNLLVPLSGVTDVAFLGHLPEIRHLGGVAIATVLFNYLYWTFGFLRMSTTGTTAQAVGRDDLEEVLLIYLRNSLLALLVGCAIVALQVPLRELGFALLSATPAVKASGIDYYNTLIWGAPATLMNLVLIGWFLGRSQGTKVLILSVVNTSSNILFNYWLIVRLGWNSAGAGAGTALSQYLMLIVGLAIALREYPIRHWLKLLPQSWNYAALTAHFSLNRDILIRTFVMVSAFSLFTNLSSTLGTTVLAGNTLLLQALSVSAYFIDGVAFATESYAGTFKGAGEWQQLIKLAKWSAGISLALGLTFASAFTLFPNVVFGLLTSHQAVVSAAAQSAVWLLPVLTLGSIAYMLDGFFLGLTEGKVLRVSTLQAVCFGFAPLAIAAWMLHSNTLLWLAMTGLMAMRAATLGIKALQTLKTASALSSKF